MFSSPRLALPLLAAVLICQPVRTACSQIDQVSVRELVEQLDHSDHVKRRNAIYELVRRRESGPDVIAGFTERIDDDDRQVRFQALLGLARAGSQAQPATQALLGELDNRDAQVRYRAAVALGAIGESIVPALLRHWEENGEQERVYLSQALGIIGPAASGAAELLASALGSDSAELRREAALALVAVDGQNESRILEIARHPQEEVRRIAVTHLASMRDASPAVESALVASVNDESELVRELAIVAICKADLPDSTTTDLVETALTDESPAVRSAALAALESSHLSADGLIERLVERIRKSESNADIDTLVRALSLLDGDRTKYLSTLLKVATRQGIDQQVMAQAIASCGTQAVAPLLAQTADRPELQDLVADALSQIGVAAIEELSASISSGSESVRVACAEALGRVRPATDELVPPLKKALSDESPVVRATAVDALGSLSVELATEIVDRFQGALLHTAEDSDEQVRAALMRSLPGMPFESETKSNLIQAGLADESKLVVQSALSSLAELPKQLATSWQSVVGLVDSQSESVRVEALNALGRVDPDMLEAKATDALVQALGDSSLAARIAATEGLIRLEWSSENSVAKLRRNLSDEPGLLEVTLRAIEVAGKKAEGAQKEVANLLSHPESSIRMASVRAMAAISEDKRAVAERLTGALEDSEWSVRQAAADQLGELGSAASQAIPKLFQMLSSEEDTNFASGAIRDIGVAPFEAHQLFLDNLDSEDRRTSLYAIFLLGKMGPQGEAILPQLRDELKRAEKNRSDSSRRRYLRQAIEDIEDDIRSAKEGQDKESREDG